MSKEITSPDQYQELAQRTAGTDETFTKEKLIERLGDRKSIKNLISSLVDFTNYGNDATTLKSKIFYGKDKKVDDFNLINLNTDLSIERICNLNPKLLHGLLGLVSEAGELAEHILQHVVNGKELLQDHIEKELGDSLWFVTEGAIGNESSLKQTAETNVFVKLAARYPDKFTVEDAVARKDEA